MKYCPSPTCGYAIKHRRPMEYQNHVTACAECGTALTDQAHAVLSAVAQSGAGSTVAAGEDTMSRLAVTLIAAVLIAAGLKIPLLGFDTVALGNFAPDVEYASRFSLLSFGIAPFVTGFLLVELVALIIPALRGRRVGSALERAPLDKAALVLGAVFLLVQISQLVLLTKMADELAPSFPSAASIWGQYIASHLALLGLIYWVSRSGLLNGFALVVLVEVAMAAVTALGQLRTGFLEETITPGGVGLVVLFLAGVSAVVVRLSRSSRPSGGLGPTAVPFPISGIAPWTTAANVLSFVMVLGSAFLALDEPSEWLKQSSWGYTFVNAFLTLDFTLLFGFLFFRPRAVGQLWARWARGIDETAVVVRARALLPRAMSLAGLLLVGGVIASLLLQLGWGAPAAGGMLFEIIIGTLVTVDLIDEWRARRTMGPLVSVRPLHRMAEVEPVAYRLTLAGIPFFARSAAYRAALQFFGPHVPVEILVPLDRADEARRLLDGA